MRSVQRRGVSRVGTAGNDGGGVGKMIGLNWTILLRSTSLGTGVLNFQAISQGGGYAVNVNGIAQQIMMAVASVKWWRRTEKFIYGGDLEMYTDAPSFRLERKNGVSGEFGRYQQWNDVGHAENRAGKPLRSISGWNSSHPNHFREPR